MITLLVGLSQSGDVRRSYEYDACLRHNLENQHIDRVIIIEEEAGSREAKEWTPNPKVSLAQGNSREQNSRARYSDFVSVANELGGVVVVANSDVYFDWSVRKMESIPEKTLFAITRTDMFSNIWSSDAWAFRPKLPIKGCNWSLGRSGCETAFCEQVACQLRWKIQNPCYEVRLTHMHKSGVFSSEHGRCVGWRHAPRPVLVRYTGNPLHKWRSSGE